MRFRENLKAELVYQGILVKELSAKTGISKRTLDNYLREKGSMPPADYAVLIAKALNTSVEYLVTGETASISDPQLKKYLLLFSQLSKTDQDFFIRLMEGLLKK
jgi:transcriptional regulator with XRE-family HTH domain